MIRPFLIVSLILALSCDPGYRLAPVGWAQVEGHHYSREIDGLKCVTNAVGGLVGHWWVDADLLITNADHPVRPIGVTLRTKHGEFPGQLARNPYTFTHAEVSAPGRAFVGAGWRFSESTALPEILGTAVAVEFTFAYGSEIRTVSIDYR